MMQAQVQSTSHTYESNSPKEDFKAITRCTRRRTGTVRSKSHVVSYQKEKKKNALNTTFKITTFL